MSTQVADTTAQSLAGLKILLAEDEALVAMDVECTLLDHGAELVSAPVNTCAAALEIARTCAVDLAVLDVALLDGNVFPAADELSQRNVPIAFHSGHAAREDLEERYPDAGWIAKPSHPSEIVDAVKMLAGR